MTPKHRLFLEQLAKASRRKREREALIESATEREIASLRNICYRVCRKELELPEKVIRRLRPYRRHLQDLGNSKKLKSLHSAKRRLKLSGGAILPLLLPAILSLISSIGAKKLSSAIGV